ncbi:MAG TPA: sigma-70 family RNA polymerase sigma factor [Gemmataceae bacterium]|nr:sigma-70 family RNA polymerase sigma factor [Gemmataceae bacterium]
MRLQAGMKLAHYQILAPVGAGGMGEVYRARDARLDRDVAIKVLPEHQANTAEALARFEREAKALAAFSHPNLVAIFDVGTDQGVSFVVMEYLAGETLHQRLRQGALSLERMLEIGTAVADGLAAAHAHGVIHRDLKPANVFLSASGQVKVLDFGLARFARTAPVEETADFLTEAGRVMGTLGYMSPEQASGDIADGRGDIFSLGCVLYEMATGRRAFPGNTAAQILASVLRDQPADMDESGTRFPSGLKQLVSRCLAKRPEDRFQSAGDVAIALKRLVQGGGDAAPSASDSSTISRPCIAVLPLANFSANKAETDFIVDGMTEMLIAELARNRALRVVSRTTVMQYKEGRGDLRQIGRELRADAIIEGSVLLAGSSGRITAQLIRADTDEHLWAESYQREVRDVLGVQNEVAQAIAQAIQKVFFDEIYRSESRRVLATLIRLLGDFDLAEEALQEAFAAAFEQWPREGLPPNPRAWLVSTGRFKGIDAIRRRARQEASLDTLARRIEEIGATNTAREDQDIEDDRLRLIFTCCHPALPQSTQVALTLREVCGLTTEEIARALLTSPTTVAQRIVRGKAKIRAAGIPYQVPSATDVPERLASVLQVTYLVFNEGYAASSGESLTRHDLSMEAIRLGRLIVELLPECETFGLLALMLLQESRRIARSSPTGDIILLEDQDRSLWNQGQIREGKSHLARALSSPPVGPYTIQAAIAAVHAEAASPAETDWHQIVQLYDALLRIEPSPVVALNQAVAVAMRDGPQEGLELIDEILENGDLADYHLAHAARADMCRRLGRTAEARESYEQALALTKQEPERRFLEKRLRELEQK